MTRCSASQEVGPIQLQANTPTVVCPTSLFMSDDFCAPGFRAEGFCVEVQPQPQSPASTVVRPAGLSDKPECILVMLFTRRSYSTHANAAVSTHTHTLHPNTQMQCAYVFSLTHPQSTPTHPHPQACTYTLTYTHPPDTQTSRVADMHTLPCRCQSQRPG